MVNNFEIERDRLAYPLDIAGPIAGVSKAKLRKDIAEGKLKAKKNGAKVVVLREDLIDYLNRELKDWTPGTFNTASA